MDLTPSQVSNASFRTAKKGYAPDEVDSFLGSVAAALEEAQQQATAMEARARAAVARLQEVAASSPPGGRDEGERAGSDSDVHASRDESETISRTLLLAQRTADTAVAEAEAEAERIREEARVDAESTIDSTREMSAQLMEEARQEARQATQSERESAENEVQSLVARREFLVGDVDHLERFLDEQRLRLRAAAHEIEELCDRVPGGLGEVRRPLLSASDDEPGDETAELIQPHLEHGHLGEEPFATISDLAAAIDDVDELEGLAADERDQGGDNGDGETAGSSDEAFRRTGETSDDTPPDGPPLPIRGSENQPSD